MIFDPLPPLVHVCTIWSTPLLFVDVQNCGLNPLLNAFIFNFPFGYVFLPAARPSATRAAGQLVVFLLLLLLNPIVKLVTLEDC